MTKTYRSENCIIGFTLLVKGYNLHIQFRPSTRFVGGGRGSVFTTSDPDLQEALEKNPRFGSSYYLETEDIPVEETKQEEAKPQLQQVKVNSLADAKAWLVDNKNWVPKTRITKKSLIDTAAEFGVEFVGIE